jgi:hypothetical protein
MQTCTLIVNFYKGRAKGYRRCFPNAVQGVQQSTEHEKRMEQTGSRGKRMACGGGREKEVMTHESPTTRGNEAVITRVRKTNVFVLYISKTTCSVRLIPPSQRPRAHPSLWYFFLFSPAVLVKLAL